MTIPLDLTSFFTLGALALVSSLASAWGTHLLLGYRVKGLEGRMKALDDPERGVLYRVTRLEARLPHQGR